MLWGKYLHIEMYTPHTIFSLKKQGKKWVGKVQFKVEKCMSISNKRNVQTTSQNTHSYMENVYGSGTKKKTFGTVFKMKSNLKMRSLTHITCTLLWTLKKYSRLTIATWEYSSIHFQKYDFMVGSTQLFRFKCHFIFFFSFCR